MRLPQAGICRGTWFGKKPDRAKAYRLEMKLKNLSVKKTIDFIFKYPVENLYGGPDVAPLRQSGC